jgi:hypothetical protein
MNLTFFWQISCSKARAFPLLLVISLHKRYVGKNPIKFEK